MPAPESKRDFESVPKPVATELPSTVDRAAAFAAGPERIPRKVIVAFVVCVAVLGLGGAVLDRLFTGPAGGASTTAAPANAFPPPLVQSATTAAPNQATTPAPSQLPATLSALMALGRTTPRAAPNISLTDQLGLPVSLASFRGKVVVLSFYDASCDDICPVLATELAEAYRDLGSDASKVALLTVNTDPLALSPASAGPAEAAAHISTVTDWRFLSGSLSQLDAEWSAYGISVEVQRSARLVSHTDELYFIDPAGRLRFRATPFSNESSVRVFTLPAATETAWATGIADEARSLLEVKP